MASRGMSVSDASKTLVNYGMSVSSVNKTLVNYGMSVSSVNKTLVNYGMSVCSVNKTLVNYGMSVCSVNKTLVNYGRSMNRILVKNAEVQCFEAGHSRVPLWSFTPLNTWSTVVIHTTKHLVHCCHSHH